jgi:hypothetical protein
MCLRRNPKEHEDEKVVNFTFENGISILKRILQTKLEFKYVENVWRLSAKRVSASESNNRCLRSTV